MVRLIKALVFILFVTSTNAQTISGNSENYTHTDIANELAKYPAGLVPALIDKIAVTDVKGGLAIRCHREIRLSADAGLRNMKLYLHHEVSSFVLYRGKCDDTEAIRKVNEIRNKFIALNGKFNYDATLESTNAGQAWNKIDENTELGQHFYRYYYSMSSFENDFNVIAESLFSDGEKTVAFMISNLDKPVGKKIQLVIDFYTAVDGRFSKAYFQKQKL